MVGDRNMVSCRFLVAMSPSELYFRGRKSATVFKDLSTSEKSKENIQPKINQSFYYKETKSVSLELALEL